MPVKTFVREYGSVADGTIKEIFERLDNDVNECFRNMEIGVTDTIHATSRAVIIIRKVTYSTGESEESLFYPPGAD